MKATSFLFPLPRKPGLWRWARLHCLAKEQHATHAFEGVNWQPDFSTFSTFQRCRAMHCTSARNAVRLARGSSSGLWNLASEAHRSSRVSKLPQKARRFETLSMFEAESVGEIDENFQWLKLLEKHFEELLQNRFSLQTSLKFEG